LSTNSSSSLSSHNNNSKNKDNNKDNNDATKDTAKDAARGGESSDNKGSSTKDTNCNSKNCTKGGGIGGLGGAQGEPHSGELRLQKKESGLFGKTCLNMSTWGDLNALVAQAEGVRMIFGLNEVKRLQRDRGTWDPENARKLLQYSIDKKYKIWGLELGNELNIEMEPEAQAKDIHDLHKMLDEIYPKDSNNKPKLLGPDPHSFKNHANKWAPLLDYLTRYMGKIRELGTPLHAVTTHEYIQVGPVSILSPKKLGISGTIARRVNETLHKSLKETKTELWAGEIGPQNAGSPPCDHTSMRWANFSDGFWYLDSMGSKARTGYSVFCRQDLVGADYGMLDCSTLNPLPDFYNALIWKKLMGTRVLRTRESGNSMLRAYAHCAKDHPGGVAFVLMNLSLQPIPVVLAAGGSSKSPQTQIEYRLSGPDGLYGHRIALNGKVLEMDEKGTLPTIQGERNQLTPGKPYVVEPLSYAFVVLPDANVAACKA